MTSDPASETAAAARAWPVLRSFENYAGADVARDIVAGITLAAIAVPEQMATARLGGFGPETGFLTFIAGSLGFAIFGASRCLSAGADSTITPIFAGGLAAVATMSSNQYESLAAALAVMVGVLLICGGLLRLGWIADLLSVPVTTGFLAGIAIHIIVSQLPALLGIAAGDGRIVDHVVAIWKALPSTNPYALGLGTAVFLATLGAERISARIPGALIGIALATGCVVLFDLDRRGVPVLGHVPRLEATPFTADFAWNDIVRIAPLALIVALVIMVQTAATSRAFSDDADTPPAIDRDFIGIGAGSLFSGGVGGFAINASPPRTAIVSETGGRSQLASIAAACLVAGLGLFGNNLLARIPQAALAGILLFVALRIVRLPSIADVYRQTLPEFVMIMVTAVAIVLLPIEIGVATGILLSLLNGMWTTTRAQTVELRRLPGTSIWWPPEPGVTGETVTGVIVVAFQAPLSFLNAYAFERSVLAAVSRHDEKPRLVVLDASSIADIDYTAARVLAALIHHFRTTGAAFAVARLGSLRAQQAFARFGLLTALGEGRVFHSVDEAVRRLSGPPEHPPPAMPA